MKEILNYIDIILLGLLVLVLAFILFRVLGRTGGYKREDKAEGVTIGGGKGYTGVESAEEAPSHPVGSLFYKLGQIASKDKTFTKDKFIVSAKKAFEMIVSAFSVGDLKNIEPFISKKIHEVFSANIEERKQKGKELLIEIKKFLSVEIMDVDINDNQEALVQVKFVTQQINEEKDLGATTENISGELKEVSEVWAFSKNLKQSTYVWTLVKIAKYN